MSEMGELCFAVQDAFCGTRGLRFLNVLFAGGTHVTVTALCRQLHPGVAHDYASLVVRTRLAFPLQCLALARCYVITTFECTSLMACSRVCSAFTEK